MTAEKLFEHQGAILLAQSDGCAVWQFRNETGDGTMTTEPIAALTDLIHGIITLPVHEVRRNADYADVTGVFQNA